MGTMLKAVCIFVLILSCGVLFYSFWQAINTVKRNKAKDEANRMIFVAQIEKARANNMNVVKTSSMVHPEIVPKNTVNYEEKVRKTEEDEIDTSGMRLKDFYKPTKK